MHELIVNGQPIPHTDKPTTPHYSPVSHNNLVDDGPHLFISDITGTITIRQSALHDITVHSPIPIVTSHDHLTNSVFLRMNRLSDPPPQDSQIIYPEPTISITLEINAMSGVTIHLCDISGEVIIDSLICHLAINNCHACKISTPKSSIRSINANLIGDSQLKIDLIEGNAKISAHDNANILISSGVIHQLDLTTYGSAFTKIKAIVDKKAVITNAGIHSIHLAKVLGNIIPRLTCNGDIVIDSISETNLT